MLFFFYWAICLIKQKCCGITPLAFFTPLGREGDVLGKTTLILDGYRVQSTFPASMNPLCYLVYLNCVESRTHSWAIPAFLTAEETALMAQQMAFRSWVRSPVASGTLRCSESTNRVSVIQFVSIEEAMINRWCLQWTNKRYCLSS